MSNFLERQVDAIVDLVEGAQRDGLDEFYIPITRPFYEDANDEAPIAKYIKKNTEEYYWIASDQWTIRPENKDTDLLDILTTAGLELHSQTQEKYDAGDWKDTLSTYALDRSKSGFWSPDKESPYYVPDTDGSHWTTLNSWNNIVVLGFSESRQKWLTTSAVILITNEWCLTRSGSLYKIGTKTTLGEAHNMIDFE